MKIGICAPSTPFLREDAERVIQTAAKSHPSADLIFDEQCFAEEGHFAGSDALRREAFVNLANDSSIDAIWFVRGGYGAARIAEYCVKHLGDTARDKAYLGYSDAGNLLGGLYRAGIGFPAHGPMPADIRRAGGDAAIKRALDWLVHRDAASLDTSIVPNQNFAAFNVMTLAMMVGTPIMPDLEGHVLMLEEVSEYLYAFDRALFHVTAHLADAGLTGVRLGRVSDVPDNDRPFGEDAEAIVRRWCERSGIAYLGSADIGHDIDNKVVPFGVS